MPIRELAFKSITVVSSNDKWVSPERAEFFAKSWNSQLINIGPHGHINADTGFGEWPQGEELLKQLTQ